MRILTLDLGTSTGWAAGGDGKLMASGTQENKSGRYDGGGMRYLRFRGWLGEVKKSMGGQIDVIYFEEVRRHRGTDAAHVYGGLMAHLTAWCEEQVSKIPYQGVPVGTIKKHATGKGNVGKDPVKMFVLERFNMKSVTDDNEADALALMSWAFKQHPVATRARVRAK